MSSSFLKRFENKITKTGADGNHGEALPQDTSTEGARGGRRSREGNAT